MSAHSQNPKDPPANSTNDRKGQAEILVEARAYILSKPMLTKVEVEQLLRTDAENVERMRTRGDLLAIDTGTDTFRYPAFQLVNGSIPDTIRQVNRLLGAAREPWSVASWWLTPSARLAEGVSPADLVGTDHELSLFRMVDGMVDGDWPIHEVGE